MNGIWNQNAGAVPAQEERNEMWKKYIFGDLEDRNNPFNKVISDTYNEVIFQLLSDGLSDNVEDNFGVEQRFAICIANSEYGITFSVGISKSNLYAMPALDNFVYSYTQNDDYGENPIYVDSSYINSASPFIMPILTEKGITNLEGFISEYPSRILAIMDRITETLNDYGNDPTLHYAINTGVVEWGGIMFFPTIQGNQVMFKFELSTEIKNKLKTDTRFSNKDD